MFTDGKSCGRAAQSSCQTKGNGCAGNGLAFARGSSSTNADLDAFRSRRSELAKYLLQDYIITPDGSKENWHDFYMRETGFYDAVKRILEPHADSFVGKDILDLASTTGRTLPILIDLLRTRCGRVTTIAANETVSELLHATKAVVEGIDLPEHVGRICCDDAISMSENPRQYDVVLLVGAIHFATDAERLALSAAAYALLNKDGSFTVIDRVPWRFNYNLIPGNIADGLEDLRTVFDQESFVMAVCQQWREIKGGSVTAREPEVIPLEKENHGTTLVALTFVK